MSGWLFRLLAAFALAFATPVWAADLLPGAPSDAVAAARARAQVVAAMCAQVACRKASRAFNLQLADGGIYTLHTSPYPYLDSSGTVVLYPGETITLGISKNGNGLDPPVLISVRDPNGLVDLETPGPASIPRATLTMSLVQDSAKPATSLVAASTMGAMLKYNVRVTMVANGGVHTITSNTCPLLPPQDSTPSFTGFENRPQPIGMMVISNIRVLPPGSPMAC
jgi:hypothetical protein